MMAAFKLADITKDVAMAAARYETLGVVMEVVGRNAGYTSTEMNNFASALQKTGISMTESRSNLTKMAQAHLDLAKSTELARIAQDAAVIGNMNSSDAFAHMIYGIQSGQVEVLRTIGINVNFENSYKTLADQLGKTTKELTETEKAGARMGAVLAAGPAIAGAYEAAMNTAGKQINSLKRFLDDFEVKMGEAFGPATKTLVEAATTALKEMQEQIVRPEVQKALQDLSSSLAQTLVSLGQDIPGKILAIAGALQTVSDIYRSLPADIVGAAGAGIIGAMLFGAGAGVVIAAIALTSAKISEFKKANPEMFGNAAEQSPQPLKFNISKTVDADALVLEDRELKKRQAAYEAYNNAIAKSDAKALLSASNDPSVLKARHLEELTNALKNNAIYQAYVNSGDKAAADQWVKDSLALDKKTNSTTKATAEANKYKTVMDELDAKIQAVEASGKEETAIAKLDKEFAKMAQTLGATNPKLLYYYEIASQKIETEQLERYNKALADLATKYAEATMSKDDFAQYKIDEQYRKDVEAAIKAKFATEEYMDALNLLAAAQKKQLDMAKSAEDAKKSEQTALERSQALASMYQSMGDSSSKYYAGEIILLDIQAARYKKLMEDEKLSKEDSIKFQAAYDEWYANQKQKTDDKMLLANGTFFDGFGVAYRKSQEDLLTWGKAGQKVFQDLQKAGTTAISDGLFKTLKGDMDGFQEAWKSFCDTLLKTFTDIIAQMVIQDLFKMVLGGAATGTGGGAIGGLNTLASLASIGKSIYNLPETIAALPAKIAALPETIATGYQTFMSLFGETSVAGFEAIEASIEAARISALMAKESAEIIASASGELAAELAAEGAGVSAGYAALAVAGQAAAVMGAMYFFGSGGFESVVRGLFGATTSSGPTTEQMDALLRAEEAGQIQLDKTTRDEYKTSLLAFGGMFEKLIDRIKPMVNDQNGQVNEFARINQAKQEWTASNQELLKMTMAEYDHLMEQQESYWQDIINQDIINGGSIITGSEINPYSTVIMKVALEMSQDVTLPLEQKMYQLGFMATQNGWESPAVVAMIAEFKDQGVPWKSINDTMNMYGVADSYVYKRIYGEYTGTNMGDLSWEELQAALYATGIDSITMKRIEAVYSSDISYGDFMTLLSTTGLDANTIIKIQAAIDPSQRWKDLIIPVDTSGIPDGGSNQAGRATGGPVSRNTPYIVGEIGPELFVPQESGHILSNANMKKLLGMGVQGFADGTTDPFAPGGYWYELFNTVNTSSANNQESTSTPTQTLAEWAAAYEKELKKMLGLTNELGDALETINDYYTEQTKTATELGATSEQLAQMEIDHAAAKEKAIKDWMQTEIDYYNQMMGLNSELGDSLAAITKHYDDAMKSAKAAAGAVLSPDELDAAKKSAADQSADIIAKRDSALAQNNWLLKGAEAEPYFNDHPDELEALRAQYAKLNADIIAASAAELAGIDADLQAKIKLAETSANTIAAIEAAAAAVKKKAIEDWYKSEVDYYNQMMGLNTDLGDSLAEIDAHYAAAIASAKAAGASEEQLAILTQAATAVKKKAEEDYWKDAVAYYNDMMGLTDPLQSSLDAANEKFNEYAAAAEGNAEKLAAIEKARGEVLAKLLADYMKALVKPFKDLFDSLTDWAKANSKSIMELFNYFNYQDETKTQQASRHLESKYKGLNPEIDADTITKYGKLNNITTGDILKQYVTDLVDYFQSVTDALMAAYESLRNTRAAIDTDIADIANSMKTPDELDAARKAQWESSTSAEAIAVAKKTFLDSDAEQQAKLAEESHTYIMSYYQDEMTALKAKHETEIANITAIRDKLTSLTYSSFNLALPGTKQATSAQDYEKLYAAAKAPGASSSAVSSYLSFVETYLQSSQDKYKSSDSYQAIYKKVMAEIGALDTQPGKTIEELTATQTDEIKALNADVTRVLNELGKATDEGSIMIVNRLSTIFEILEGLVGYGDQQPIPASVVDMSGTDFFKITAGMITPPAGFNPDTGKYKTVDGDNPLWATVLKDNNISILEIMTYFYPLFYKQLESIGTKNNVDFFTISGMDKPTSGYNEKTGEYTGNDPLWAAVLTDGNVSIVELMSFFYPLFYNQLSDIRDSIQMFPDDFSIISGTGTTKDLSTGLQRPYTDEERRTKVLQDQKISTIEVMVYYYETFKQQFDKIIEGSGSGISQTDFVKITADSMNAFSSYSNGKEMATVAELLVVGFYSIIQFNNKLFLYIVAYLPKLADIATSLSAIAGKVTAPIITTPNLNSNNELSSNILTNIAFNKKDGITAFLSSWVYNQETMPATIKTDIQFDKKDDVTEFLASWAYDQETAPTSILAKTFFDMNDPTTAAMSSWIFSGYIPTAYATVITTNIIRTIYEDAPVVKVAGDKNTMPAFADGGISYGPLSGYPAMLHGTEAIIPLPNGRTLPVEVKSTGNQSQQPDPEIKQLLRILVANQAQDKYLSVDGRQFKIFVQEQADINRVNANRRAGNETRRIT